MPTIQIQAKATRQESSLLFLELDYEGRKVEMTVHPNMSLLEMAQLAIDQPFPPLPDVKYDGMVEIVFHNETAIDPESGEEYTIRVVDSAVKV
jgi:hypothetical protein